MIPHHSRRSQEHEGRSLRNMRGSHSRRVDLVCSITSLTGNAARAGPHLLTRMQREEKTPRLSRKAKSYSLNGQQDLTMIR
jgi:hypothetical protein